MSATIPAANYAPLGARRSIRSETNDGDVDLPAPKDRKNLVYIAMLTAGIGFVLPYNSFLVATDYWQDRFKGKPVALDMSMTYILVAFLTVLLNNVFLSLASFKVRVIFGYIISFTTLIFVALCEVAWHMFSASSAYAVNLAAVGMVAIGCTVQQSSFYGFASMLPKQYTQAVMSGESLAGFLVSSNRVVTKLLIRDDKISTVLFFLTSTIYIAFSYGLYTITKHSPFVKYYTKKCSKIILRPDEYDGLHEPDTSNSESNIKYGVLKLDHSNSEIKMTGNVSQALSFTNPVYELSNPSAGENILDDLHSLPEIPPATPSTDQPNSSVSFKVEHILTPEQILTTRASGKLSDFKSGFENRRKVSQAIYPYMVSIALAYCVTLSLYPGIESEIVSCAYGSWMPVLLMYAFNTSDLIGKVLAAVPYNWSRRQLILLSGLRVILVPLLLLCAAPRSQPVIMGESAPFVFTIALGLTNGLAGSLPMMLAPVKVPATLREVTGNMMTLSYNVGLTAGSLIGYVFESMLGAQKEDACKAYNMRNINHISTQFNYTGVMNSTISPVYSSTAATVLTTVSTLGVTLITAANTTFASLLSTEGLTTESSDDIIAKVTQNLTTIIPHFDD